MTPEGGARTRIPFAALCGVIASITVFGVARGLSNPLVTLLMQEQGISARSIGLSAAMTPLGLMTSSLVVLALVNRQRRPANSTWHAGRTGGQAIGPLGPPAVVAMLGAILIVFSMIRSLARRESPG